LLVTGRGVGDASTGPILAKDHARIDLFTVDLIKYVGAVIVACAREAPTDGIQETDSVDVIRVERRR
jgi:hypothetical protein